MNKQTIDLPFLKQKLRKLGLSAKKSFGQNFLVNQNILQQICEAATIQPDETVVEIGPGPGGLTQYLLEKTKKLIAVELDSDMVKLLKNNLREFTNLEIVHQNALDYFPEEKNYKIVANIPYHITSPLLRHYLLEMKNQPLLVVLMIQDEVARKITDPKNESVLSLQVKVFGEPKYLFKVPQEDFFPVPKIDSAVISIQSFAQPLVQKTDLDNFFKVVKIGFRQKRKKLINSFLAMNHFSKTELEKIFQQAGVDSNRRPQTLSIEEWKKLSWIWKEVISL